MEVQTYKNHTENKEIFITSIPYTGNISKEKNNNLFRAYAEENGIKIFTPTVFITYFEFKK
ncbi:MAG: hypothetical protein AAF518_21360, partial [Spirochaetota bacterium]